MFDMAVTVGILGAIADDVSGILGAGGLSIQFSLVCHNTVIPNPWMIKVPIS